MLTPLKTALCFLIVAFAASSADAALVGFWKNDEASGPLIDSTGGHPPGVATGTPTYGLPGVPNGTYGAITVTGAFGTAIEYGPSNVDEFFTIGTDNNNPVMNLDPTGAFTVMGWVNPLAPTAASTYRFLSTGSGAGGDRGWGIGLRVLDASGFGSSIRFTTYGIADNDSATFDVSFGTWVHVAATYNNGAIDYFLNGNALDSDTSSFGIDTAAARLVVGGRLGANDVDQMNGDIDGVQVYDQVLSAAQIRQAAVGSVVPEPSAVILSLVGVLGFMRRRR
jgi:hypothetical protein